MYQIVRMNTIETATSYDFAQTIGSPGTGSGAQRQTVSKEALFLKTG